MFDRYSIAPKIHHGPSRIDVIVTERRAPTDDSVKLLGEMEEAALKKLIASVQLPNNEFHGEMFVFEDCLEVSRKVKVVFTINKKKITTDVTLHRENGREDAVKKVFEAVAKDIAANILEPIFRAIPREQQAMLLRGN